MFCEGIASKNGLIMENEQIESGSKGVRGGSKDVKARYLSFFLNILIFKCCKMVLASFQIAITQDIGISTNVTQINHSFVLLDQTTF